MVLMKIKHSQQYSLWDNGADPITELERMSEVRKTGISNFGMGSLKNGEPMAALENVFVPLYLSQRYQVEAVSKLIGGLVLTF